MEYSSPEIENILESDMQLKLDLFPEVQEEAVYGPAAPEVPQEKGVFKVFFALLFLCASSAAAAYFCAAERTGEFNLTKYVFMEGLYGTVSSGLRLCAGDLIQTALIFASGFTFYPLFLGFFVTLYRGACLGVCAAVISGSNSLQSFFIMISYGAVTFLLIGFAVISTAFSRRMKKGETGLFPSYFISSMTILGATVILRLMPFILF